MSLLEDSNASEHSRCDRYPIADASKAEVVQQYIPHGETKDSQLQLNVGDIVWVLDHGADSGWWGGHKVGDDNTGWFPSQVCRILQKGDYDESVAEDDRFASAEHSALFTSDHRAVASPQAKGTSRTQVAREHELEERVKGIEKALDAERQKVKRLEEENKMLQISAQEFQSKASKAQEDRNRKESELARKDGEIAQKEADFSQQREVFRKLEANLWSERQRSDQLEAKLSDQKEQYKSLEAEYLKVHAELAHKEDSIASLARDDIGASRNESRGMPRRFYSADGHRTPTMGMGPPHTVASLSPSHSGVPVPTSSSLPAAPTLPLSARPLQPQPVSSGRGAPSPRAAPSVMSSSMQGSGVGQPPASPHLRQRMVAHVREPSSESQKAGVRSLVSEFERRSNSQGAPMTRDTPQQTNRQLVFATSASSVPAPGTATMASYSPSSARRAMAMAATSSATIRTSSREVSVGRPMAAASSSRTGYPRKETDPETPHPSPNSAEDTQKTLNFGMSPITRHNYALPRQGFPGHSSVGATSFSPQSATARSTMSVQDRISQLNKQFSASRYIR
eukprot:TRINITY_DN79263_c0_g1_i1.p1 TRINITY_DN79263_c0_g1~~TRINITY_DN79263_c0_g1_i1.p1  ORF type:complete len:566 (+),score=86.90 TRINITY_DN79263_c0_g1_i1:92-1789(+)